MATMKKSELGTIGAYSYGKPNDGIGIFIYTKDGKKNIRNDIAYLDVVDGKFKLCIKKDKIKDFKIEIIEE